MRLLCTSTSTSPTSPDSKVYKSDYDTSTSTSTSTSKRHITHADQQREEQRKKKKNFLLSESSGRGDATKLSMPVASPHPELSEQRRKFFSPLLKSAQEVSDIKKNQGASNLYT